MSDSVLSATVTSLDNDEWQLEINQVKEGIEEVYFPWFQSRWPLDSDVSDDIVYYPFAAGFTEKVDRRNEDFAWLGNDEQTYPGGTIAPLIVTADRDNGQLVAAINWPPRKVIPRYAAQRMVMWYKDTLSVGSTAVYRALVAQLTGDSSSGSAPWQLAVDRYRAWLDIHVAVPTYPPWMWQGQGMFTWGLQNMPTVDLAFLRDLWRSVKDTYPWFQLWGQMSDYAGDCCDRDQSLHARYSASTPPLAQFMRTEVTGAGYHGGYYVSPYLERSSDPGDRTLLLDTPEGQSWITSWLQKTVDWGANAFYADTVGGVYWGDPTTVMNLFTSGFFPRDLIVERIVDIYPRAGILSGGVTGYSWMCGAPGKKPEEWPITSYAAFGRYLMRDRLVFSGSGNSDWSFWSTSKSWRNLDPAAYGNCNYETYCATTGLCDHGTEREMFLLGNKIETSWVSYAGAWWGINPFLDRIVELRGEVRWWDRRPVYYHTKGLILSAVPASAKVEVRRFVDTDGVDLLAIWNGTGTAGLSLVLGGRTVGIPSQELSILDLETRPPVVSGVAVTGATSTSATVSWTTDEPAESLVEYGAAPEYGSTAKQVALVTAHSVVLSDLVADTLYHYRVRSADRNGNASEFTPDATFVTPAVSDTTPPSTPNNLRRINDP